jgi:hypothetical protein
MTASGGELAVLVVLAVTLSFLRDEVAGIAPSALMLDELPLSEHGDVPAKAGFWVPCLLTPRAKGGPAAAKIGEGVESRCDGLGQRLGWLDSSRCESPIR